MDKVIKMDVSAGVIIKEGENGEQMVLLIQRAKEDHYPLFWEFPRGKCDYNDESKKGRKEPLIPCLKREVKEETGLDVVPIKFIDKFTYTADHGKRLSTQHNFLCKLKNPEQNIKLSKEHDDSKWVTSVGEVELMVLPEMKKTISKVLNTDIRLVDYPENFIDDEDTTIKETYTMSKVTESYLKDLTEEMSDYEMAKDQARKEYVKKNKNAIIVNHHIKQALNKFKQWRMKRAAAKTSEQKAAAQKGMEQAKQQVQKAKAKK